MAEQPDTTTECVRIPMSSPAGNQRASRLRTFGVLNQHGRLLTTMVMLLTLIVAWYAPLPAIAAGPDGTSSNEQDVAETLIDPLPQVRRARTDIVEHTVTDGDTVYDIAAKYGLSPETLIAANNMEARPDKLSLGQKLVVLPVDGVLHVVQQGDTLGAIASRYQAKAEAIQAANQLGAGATLRAGQQLVVPDGVKPRPTPRPAPPPAPTQAPPPQQAAQAAPAESAQATPPSPPTADAVEYAWPLRGTISQGYLPYHQAIDILSAPGTPILASAAGTVTRAGWSNDGYGYNVVLDHGKGMGSLYAHLQRIDVKVGQVLQQGEVLGGCGATGRATAFHLHFEITKNGARKNPRDYLK